jgi:hypothetical protein
MNDLKFIIFSDSSKNIGGQELQALQQMRTLNQSGHQTLLLAKPGSAILTLAQSYGLMTLELPFRNALHIPSLLKIWNLVKSKRPDAMICHGSHDALICALAGKFAKWSGGQSIPVLRVKTFQHGYPLSFAYNNLFSKTITPSQFLREKFLVNKSIHPQKIQFIKNAAAHYQFANPQWKWLQFDVIAIYKKPTDGWALDYFEDVYF